MAHPLISGILVLLVVPLSSQAQDASIAEQEFEHRVSLLKSLPANTDRLCVGITAVAATFLHAPADPQLEMQLEKFAQKIYANLSANERLPVPAKVSIAGKSQPVNSPATVKILVGEVFSLYKQDFQRAIRSQAGVERIRSAERRWVQSLDELKKILTAAPNHIGITCCIGQRTFPDGAVKESNHAVLLEALPHDMFVVYDPNAPGQAIECQVAEQPDGVTLTWTCMYRDTGQETTQTYRVVPAVDYFNAVRH